MFGASQALVTRTHTAAGKSCGFLLGLAMATAKKKPAAKRKTGRPTKYTKELADKICELLAEGKSINQISKMRGMPHRSTVWGWQDEHPECFDKTARARARCGRLR